MAAGDKQLRVSFIAGALSQGGAEKQFIYMLRALKSQGAEVQVLSLTEGQYHEQNIRALGIRPIPIANGQPAVRLMRIRSALRAFRPHFVQATHFFTTLYAGAAGRLLGIPSIGAVRGDLYHDLQGVGRAGPLLLRLPSVLLANSFNARDNAVQLGVSPSRVLVLPNVIDLDEFDRLMARPATVPLSPDRIRAITVARLIPVKRLERFLQALAIAKIEEPLLQGVIVGGGREEAALRKTATELGLLPDQPDGYVHFLGEQSDIPSLLGQADIAVLTSDREGFPNVLLEAMAASVPILSTPAGEARLLVQDGKNGHLVPFDDTQALARHLIQLARSSQLRCTLGSQGRAIVEQKYSFFRLEQDLLNIYREIARMLNRKEILSMIENQSFAAG